MNTTRAVDTTKLEDITFESMMEAIEKMPPTPKLARKIEVNKKDYKTLMEASKKVEVKENMGLVGSLYGVKIIVKPGIRKAKIYYE